MEREFAEREAELLGKLEGALRREAALKGVNRDLLGERSRNEGQREASLRREREDLRRQLHFYERICPQVVRDEVSVFRNRERALAGARDEAERAAEEERGRRRAVELALAATEGEREALRVEVARLRAAQGPGAGCASAQAGGPPSLDTAELDDIAGALAGVSVGPAGAEALSPEGSQEGRRRRNRRKESRKSGPDGAGGEAEPAAGAAPGPWGARAVAKAPGGEENRGTGAGGGLSYRNVAARNVPSMVCI